MKALLQYDWPGNIRELEHVIERAMILSDAEIGLEHLSNRITGESAYQSARDSDPETLEEVERRHVLSVLDGVDGDKAAAAKILGIDLSTLYRKMKRYDLD